ncbi:glycosyltransferase family 2 protein [Chryseobacterium sp. RG1]|uniref:Glycosyltransferase family 2 protein n=1 Tax=Chryseobacterium tagetis TaxID=2801334 RepID=A0ABS8A539_9FLAO|nr:glycosyltransferase family 2 protein [Chryseobacterium tagetis]MCA6069104.1 glycosyltransferase family 2 protein [Chryseobacterium tagetis]
MKLLTIAIPTYNRASILKDSLAKIIDQISGKEDLIELLVSDNCSPDETQDIVYTLIQKGNVINYNRNEENLGMDGNFSYCFNHAKGKYIWILGDDDYLLDGALDKIINILRKDEYGLIHLNSSKLIKENEIFYSSTKLLNTININITFISGNIVNRNAVQKVNFDNYRGTLLSQVPVYLNAAKDFEKSIIINQQLLETAVDSVTNGGYNIFEVFVINYLNILKEFKIDLGNTWYEIQKFKLCRNFLWIWMCRLLLNPHHGLRFKTDGWLKIIWKYYWYEIYFYPMMTLFSLKKIFHKL